MMLNMLNVQITDRITAGTSAGLIDGRVIDLNCCQREAPSTRAASYRSAEIDCKAPSEITIMNGNDSQPLVVTTAAKLVSGLSNQAMAEPPKICRIWLITPNCGWNMPFQISAVM